MIGDNFNLFRLKVSSHESYVARLTRNVHGYLRSGRVLWQWTSNVFDEQGESSSLSLQSSGHQLGVQ